MSLRFRTMLSNDAVLAAVVTTDRSATTTLENEHKRGIFRCPASLLQPIRFSAAFAFQLSVALVHYRDFSKASSIAAASSERPRVSGSNSATIIALGIESRLK